MSTVCIENATLYDGTGCPPVQGSLWIQDGVIHMGRCPYPCQTIDASGLCLAPGFIDTHSHADECLGSLHSSLSRVSQGITTQLAGNCGQSAFFANGEMYAQQTYRTPSPGLDGPESFAGFGPYVRYASSLPLVENTALLVGHNNLRRLAMGFDNRRPTPAELQRMKDMLTEAMEHGAFGLSSGLIYIPGAYSDKEEMIELCKIVAKYDGLYCTHMRNESEGVLDSIRESIEVARESGCRLHISHLKVCGKRNHGVSGQMLALIDEARRQGVRVSADQYPYEASSTKLCSCIPPKYFTEGPEGLMRMLHDEETRRVIRSEIENDSVPGFENLVLGCGGFDGIGIAEAPGTPQCEGKTIGQYARECGLDPFEVFFDILRRDGDRAFAIYYDIGEEDVRTILADERIMVGTDGSAPAADVLCHPRAFGTFTRVLGRYGREKSIAPMEKLIYKMTLLPARTLGLDSKGLIAEGFDADLVLFDAQTVCDCADFSDGHRLSRGIHTVWVGGQPVFENGGLTGKTPGKILLHRGAKA